MLCSPLVVCGQFQGGAGDGTTFGYFGGLLNGEILPIYTGSLGDGHDFSFGASLTMQPGCDFNIALSNNTIDPGIYQAENQIAAKGVLTSGEVIFRSGNEVLLIPNMEVDLNSIFTIDIMNCNLSSLQTNQNIQSDN